MTAYQDMTDKERVEYWKVLDIKGNDSAVEKVDPPADMVNQPSHYNYGTIECIDAIKGMLGEEGFTAYCRGNALKYTWRAGLKFNKKEDLAKASWYNRMASGDDPRRDGKEAISNEPYWSAAASLAGWVKPDDE